MTSARFTALMLFTLVACEKGAPAPAASRDVAPPTSATPPADTPPAAAKPPAAEPQAGAAPQVAQTRSPASATPAQLAALEHLICFGNEPFWAVQFKPDGSATCEAMCEGPPGLRIVNVALTSDGDPQSFELIDAGGSTFLRGALKKTGKCSDGMSDNVHPYVFSGSGKPGVYEGCCRDRRVKLPFG